MGDPPNRSDLTDLGRKLLAEGRVDELLRFAQEVVAGEEARADPRIAARVLRFCGDGFRSQRRFAEAEEHYRLSLLFEASDWTRYGLAVCLCRTRRLPEARAAVAEILRGDADAAVLLKLVPLARDCGAEAELHAFVERALARARPALDLLEGAATVLADAELGEVGRRLREVLPRAALKAKAARRAAEADRGGKRRARSPELAAARDA